MGKIYARTPAGYTCEMEVVVKEDIDNIVFRLDSIVSDCHYEYPVEVSMTKSTGEVVPLNPSALSWSSSDEHVAFVENGVLKGLQNGMAEICGSISGVSDTLKVKVQVNNLFTWCKAGSDIDPESYGMNDGTRGIASPKTYSIGLSTSF